MTGRSATLETAYLACLPRGCHMSGHHPLCSGACWLPQLVRLIRSASSVSPPPTPASTHFLITIPRDGLISLYDSTTLAALLPSISIPPPPPRAVSSRSIFFFIICSLSVPIMHFSCIPTQSSVFLCTIIYSPLFRSIPSIPSLLFHPTLAILL